MSGAFKVAAVQAAPVFLDLDKTVDKAISLIDDAGKQGVKLIAFPETWIPGYPWWIWLGAPAWGMQFVGRYFENAIEAGSPQDDRLREAAKRNAMQVVVGVSEKAGGSLYMGQWHYGPDGEVVSRRRKLKPTHVERTVFGEGDGSDMVVCDTSIGRVGALCCWEHLQPLTKYAMYSQNEQIHIASWPSFSLYRGAAYALGPELNTSASQMYAAEGQCFVLAACATVSEEMYELLCDTPDKQQFLQPGGGFARIFAPDGSPLGEPLGEREEGLLVAEIDLCMIAYAKAAADPVGHYSRPDVFRLMFNQPPYPSFMSEFDPDSADAAMAVMGCQFNPDDRTAALGFATGLAALAGGAGRADHVDLSSCECDSAGRRQFVVTAYWLTTDAPEAFFEGSAFKQLWHRHSAEARPYGIFREVFNIPLERFETLHSDPGHIVGIAHARAGVTPPIDRHAYWGSMRDRIPAAANDAFAPAGSIEVLEQSDHRIVVRPSGNLALIRSGQDLRGVEGSERSEYYAEVEPVLRSGMAFLRDEGEEVNCFDCRYMAFVGDDGEKTDHTFGLAYFRSLADLERWSEQHPTHLAIFRAFLEFAPRYGPEMKSRYWHEVSVLPAQNQMAEYINCAPGTGFLAGVDL